MYIKKKYVYGKFVCKTPKNMKKYIEREMWEDVKLNKLRWVKIELGPQKPGF